jgi:type I restriction enzyme S subunit
LPSKRAVLTFKGLRATGDFDLEESISSDEALVAGMVATDIGDTVATAQGHASGWILKKVGHVNGLTTPPFVASTLQVFRPRPVAINDRYLFHVLGAPLMYEKVRHFAGTRKSLTPKQLSQITIPVLPLADQQRIASILDAADALRTKRRLALAKLDTLTQAIFVDMFGDPILQQDDDRRPLISVATVVTGNTPSRSDSANFGSDIEWVKSDNIQNSGIVTKATEALSPQGKQIGRLAPQGACLVVCIAGSPESIGRVGLLDRSVTFNQQINAVIPGPKLLPEFLLGQLRASKTLIQRASTNSMKGMVSKSALSDLNVHVPPLSEQAEFSARAQSCRESIRRVQSSLDQAEALFASLQQRAFRGEL